jgi:hypothetical protein
LKKTILVLLIACIWLPASSQYWQQQVDYTIDVSLDDHENTLSGFEKIIYTNHSPDTLAFIWFHLWPNAYKNDRTAYSEQDLINGSTRFYFSSKEDRGYINQLDFKVDNISATVSDHPEHIDIVKVTLPKPLLPNQQIVITTPFHVKLPFNFSRGGHDKNSYQITQWYPKPAVFDKYGWHAMPYLDQGEFYSEFGSFDVHITTPAGYQVAATGQLQESDKGDDNTDKTTTVHYRQDRVHDFAWFADRNFTVQSDTCVLPSGKSVTVFAYLTNNDPEIWRNTIEYARKAVKFYSAAVGEYPYNVVKVVQGPESFGGGMEYPTITVISPVDNNRTLEKTIVHEVGHNWFYSVLGTNERQHPWMDEGINTFYEQQYSRYVFGEEVQRDRILFETMAAIKRDQPIELTSEKYSEVNYNLVAYYKTAEWLRFLQEQVGEERFKAGMQEYFREWQFKHPQPEDFKNSIEQAAGKKLDSAFALINNTGTLPNQERKGSKISFVFGISSLKDYGKHPTKDLYIIGPAIGGNAYDNLMAGVFVTNLKLPPSRLKFLLAPMYGTGSKAITGIGFASYNLYSRSRISRTEFTLAASRFSMNKLSQEDGSSLFLHFNKIVPGIRLTFRNKDPRSNQRWFIQLRGYFIREDGLRFFRDTVISGIDTTIRNRFATIPEDRTLTQVRVVVENNRVLYPYSGELKVEQGKYFMRAAFTGSYFFNYVKEGGLKLRLFAGKFFYTSSKTASKQFATDRYHLNLTGANGYEDYTFSDYFIGRNKFQGFASQQIMVRDGAFKVRTDLLADKVGKSDDWLAAVNLSTTIPKEINPLSMLPVKIPLGLFLDIGTYAAAWKQDANLDRFLYDAGVEVSLLKETVKIYLPLIYSSIFKDYIQSTLQKKGRIWKKVSFSIDISNFSFHKLDRHLSF